MIKKHLTDYIPETLDFVSGPTSMILQNLDETNTPSHFSLTPIPVEFQITPYIPDIQGTLFRQKECLGTITWNKDFVPSPHHALLTGSLIRHIRCQGPDESSLVEWTFQTPESGSHFILKEEKIDDQWDVSFSAGSLQGNNLVPLIPIGGIWINRSSLISLRQVYVFITTQKNHKPYWYVIDDHQLQEWGITTPNGGYRGKDFFKPLSPQAPPRPCLQDLSLSHVTEDFDMSVSGKRLDPINPETLRSTLYLS